MWWRTFFFVGATVIASACTPNGTGLDRDLEMTPRLSTTSEPGTIDFKQAQAMPNGTALDLVHRYNANFVYSRNALSSIDPMHGTQVFVDGVRFGAVSSLSEIRANEVREIRFLSGSEAAMKYGPNLLGGVIDVVTRAR